MLKIGANWICVMTCSSGLFSNTTRSDSGNSIHLNCWRACLRLPVGAGLYIQNDRRRAQINIGPDQMSAIRIGLGADSWAQALLAGAVLRVVVMRATAQITIMAARPVR